jgi:Na+/melibiose symporter-like transporter
MPDMSETLTPQEKKQLRTIRFVFIAMAGFLAIIFLSAIVYVTVEGPLEPSLNVYRTWLLIACVSVTLICGWIGRKRLIKTIEAAKNSSESLSAKLAKYQSSLIVYLALTEMPMIFCIVLLVCTGDSFYQIFAAALLGSLLVQYPKEEKVLRQFL